MRALTAMAGLTVLAACVAPAGLEVSEARMAEPTGANAAVYLTVSSGAPDRLVGAVTSIAARVETHDMAVSEDGLMTMYEVDGFPVGPGDTLVLEPGGRHLMLVDADRLGVGDTVAVTLLFEVAGEVSVNVPVVGPEAVMAGTEDGHG